MGRGCRKKRTRARHGPGVVGDAGHRRIWARHAPGWWATRGVAGYGRGMPRGGGRRGASPDMGEACLAPTDVDGLSVAAPDSGDPRMPSGLPWRHVPPLGPVLVDIGGMP